MYAKELKISQMAARQAGRMLKKEFLNKRKEKTTFKQRSQRVTPYDKKSEKIILDILNKNFPHYKTLSEESGANKKIDQFCWVIDPLDGTTNFTINNPQFSVSIALLKNNEVVLGVIYNPILDDLYWATKNNGAYRNSHKLKVSAKKDLKKSVITYCHGTGPKNNQKAYKLYQRFNNISHQCRHFGSTNLELAMVAAGNTEAHLTSGPKIWDVAAGTIIAREAGAMVTDWKNKTWNKNSKNLLAANPAMHSLCLKELKKLKLA